MIDRADSIRKLKEQSKIPKEQKKYVLPKKSKKKIEQEKQSRIGGDTALDMWFEQRREEMKGKCVLCGGKTEKLNNETYRRSLHHLFEKRKTMFPSVALQENNFLELCFYGNSCHQNIHSGKITWELLMDSAEWNIIGEKVLKIFPFIKQEERKNIPDVLINWIEKNLK